METNPTIFEEDPTPREGGSNNTEITDGGTTTGGSEIMDGNAGDVTGSGTGTGDSSSMVAGNEEETTFTSLIKMQMPHANVDKDYGPYTTIDECLKILTVSKSPTSESTTSRGIGLTVGIYQFGDIEPGYDGDRYKLVTSGGYSHYVKDDSGDFKIVGITDYWFEKGIEDNDLVTKESVPTHNGEAVKGKYLKVNDKGKLEWAEASGVPSTDDTQEGDILTIDAEKKAVWKSKSEATGIPIYDSGKKGQVLAVSEDGESLEWKTVQSGGGAVFSKDVSYESLFSPVSEGGLGLNSFGFLSKDDEKQVFEEGTLIEEAIERIVNGTRYTINVTPYNKAYDGNTHKVVFTANPSDGVVFKYKEGSGGTWGNAEITAKDYCNKTIYAKLLKEGKTVAEQNGILKIDRRTLSFSGSDTKKTYNNAPQSTLTITINNTIAAEPMTVIPEHQKITGTNVGVYAYTYTIDDIVYGSINMGNYTINPSTKKLTIQPLVLYACTNRNDLEDWSKIVWTELTDQNKQTITSFTVADIPISDPDFGRFYVEGLSSESTAFLIAVIGGAEMKDKYSWNSTTSKWDENTGVAMNFKKVEGTHKITYGGIEYTNLQAYIYSNKTGEGREVSSNPVVAYTCQIKQ